MSTKTKPSALFTQVDMQSILYASTANPHSILGLHPHKSGSVLRIFDPAAQKIEVKIGRSRRVIPKISDDGFFALSFDKVQKSDYLITRHYDETAHTTADAYSFLPSISDFDLHLFTENDLRDLTSLLGARVKTINKTQGTRFVLWAPNVQRVSVIGNFNSWDGRRHIMRTLGSSGLWEIFIPGLPEGEF
ncbi:MAG: 1,4-alpha-glucan branching enzyme, partial [Lentisphaeraceae bacterium]|nr:1,4-alpha-glucan branching enzyme [Lentisphaeraceae bacterium]